MVLLAATALRILFVAKVELYDGDTFVYGELAKNWLNHGILGLTGGSSVYPTYIRLPGYPAFLAAIWSITGVEHYRAVELVQLVFDLGTCFIVADLARRIVSQRAAKVAFLLTALCPFTAIYIAQPLTECLAIFFAALGLDMAVAGVEDLPSGRLRYWIACGLAVGAGILLRPDGGILLAAICIYLLVRILSSKLTRPISASAPQKAFRIHAVLAGVVLTSVALAPLVPWAMRNWRDYHEFQPLAPRYATEPDESYNPGFQRWVRTWMVDYSSVVDVYWSWPGQFVDPHVIPSRAFDSEAERQQTFSLITEYNNKEFEWTPELDSQLGKIADARIARAPFRYYLLLPALRIADMWFRPKIDLMGIDDHWWDYQNDPSGTRWSVFMGILNLFLIGAALFAVFRRRNLRGLGLLLLFVMLRSLFLGSLENPETRYTLECYPVVLALAAVALAGKSAEADSAKNYKVALQAQRQA